MCIDALLGPFEAADPGCQAVRPEWKSESSTIGFRLDLLDRFRPVADLFAVPRMVSSAYSRQLVLERLLSEVSMPQGESSLSKFCVQGFWL